MLTATEVEAVLLRVLQEVQVMSGREWKPLGADARPIGALDGFDSLNGVEVTVMLETELGCSFGVDSLFVNEDGTRAVTIAEMAERVERLAAAEENAR